MLYQIIAKVQAAARAISAAPREDGWASDVAAGPFSYDPELYGHTPVCGHGTGGYRQISQPAASGCHTGAEGRCAGC